jgi:hypothetical protein
MKVVRSIHLIALISSVLAMPLNVFVAVVQSFE